jgi:hypothetical protein
MHPGAPDHLQIKSCPTENAAVQLCRSVQFSRCVATQPFNATVLLSHQNDVQARCSEFKLIHVLKNASFPMLSFQINRFF